MDARLLVFIVISCTASCISAQIVPSLLTTNISSSGCGSTKYCPDICNATTNGSCVFVSSAYNSSANTLTFELAANTPGYVALALSTNPSQAGTSVLFLCGTNTTTTTTNTTSNITSFSTYAYNSTSGNFSILNASFVNSVQGVFFLSSLSTVNPNLVQCIISTTSTLPTTTLRIGNTGFSLSKFTGSFIGGAPSFPTNFSYSAVVNITDPNGTVTNPSSNTTTNTTTTQSPATTKAGSNPLTNPVTHALAMLLSAMCLLLLH
ncbi:uncharacterized protein [Hoplias malabaricus]|uniref:uncharacterized protein n=1 Tax=Hoplias malabaricus TaxID=27720 RepID=UPI00346244DB